MAFQLAALLTGIGHLTKAVGKITGDENTLKIGTAATKLGGGMDKIDSMLNPGEASGLGILGGSLTDPKSPLGEGTSSVLGGNLDWLGNKDLPTNQQIGIPEYNDYSWLNFPR